MRTRIRKDLAREWLLRQNFRRFFSEALLRISIRYSAYARKSKSARLLLHNKRVSSKLVACVLKKNCTYLFIVGVLVVRVHVLDEHILGIDAEDGGDLGIGTTAKRFSSVDGLGCRGGVGYSCGRVYFRLSP